MRKVIFPHFSKESIRLLKNLERRRLSCNRVKGEKDELFLNESADVLFHFLILLKAKGFSFTDVIDKLEDRKNKE